MAEAVAELHLVGNTNPRENAPTSLLQAGLGTFDYKNCIYSGPLNAGTLEKTFTIANDVNNLTLEIWRYEENVTPMVATWQRSSGMVWEIN